MILKSFLEVMGCGTVIHIGTEHGDYWVFSDIAENLMQNVPDSWQDRLIVQMYFHEGREKGQYCCELLPGIAVILEGDEIGNI